MLRPHGILALIERRTVKPSQSMGILGEMRRHPVNDHTDALMVHVIHKAHEVRRRTITGCRCVVAGHLISPGRIIGMFHDGHQLHIVITHFLHVFGKLKCDFLITEEFSSVLRTLPGTHVNLIDVHRLLVSGLLISFLHPFLILPGIMQLRYTGCICRTNLG